MSECGRLCFGNINMEYVQLIVLINVRLDVDAYIKF